MAKRGNPNLNKNALERRKRTESLIRQAVKSLEANHEIKSIPSVSARTKELDTNSKGVSEASFRNKNLEHIQSLMIELRIGKFEAITVGDSESDAELADQVLQLKKELKKKNEEIKKLKQDKKKQSVTIDIITIENEELRAVNYEMEMKSKMKLYFNEVNNRN
ncbi:hypothetical protein PGH07_03370 [Sulfurovum sp. zt1-1]|uniref:Uncharacterized protein n=1 Tax=Sulfurovum zhangzhouensis TaxID=3019067 RepID=A0ABT7QWP9_9BACT|nr:hypothetical protein [Sulfurovum zhangzhouensis]MDM5271207.1 hypothetical protein [Sulfurovum zhangzhouensis]